MNEMKMVSAEKCPGKTVAETLKTTVAERLAASGPKLYEMVVEHLASEELERRKKIALKGWNKLQDLIAGREKIKPQAIGYTDDGQEAQKLLSKEDKDKRDKLDKEIRDLDAALEKALRKEKPCYEDLKNLVG